MTDWSESAEQDAGQEMNSQPAGETSHSCQDEGWEAVIDSAPLPKWDVTLTAEPMERWQPEDPPATEDPAAPQEETVQDGP